MYFSSTLGKAVFLMDDRVGKETILSRRSSFDSTTESELRLSTNISRASTRPGTAVSHKSSSNLYPNVRTEESSIPDYPIQIPRVSLKFDFDNAVFLFHIISNYISISYHIISYHLSISECRLQKILSRRMLLLHPVVDQVESLLMT